MNGEFSLNTPNPKSDVLIISFLGMKEQRIPVNGRTRIDVTLEDDSTTLDDIVVIGYGAVKKRDLTGAVSSVKSETITMTPTSNPMEALQGRVAGLDITRESGAAGEGVKMQLRGNRSFTASGDPLFIIDGMPGDYSTLNPNDIASIEVLKDASSTAIYGSAGSNGIVIITTKQGEAGKVNVNFNAYVGVNGWAKMPSYMSGEEYVEARRQANRNAGTYTTDEQMFINDTYYYEAYKNGKYIDWGKEILKRNGLTQNYSLSVSGGNEKTKAYMSLNFSDETGQYENDNNKIYSTNIRVDHQAKKWLAIGTNVQASYLHRNRASVSLYDGLRMKPFGDIYDEDGNYAPYPMPEDLKFINVLLNNRDNYRNQQQNTRLAINPYIRITPVKGLTIESRVNATLAFNRNNAFQGQGSYYFYNNGQDWKTNTYAQITQNRNYNYKWENIFTYNFTVANDHDFTITGVTSWEHNQYDSNTVRGTGIEDNKFLWHNLGAAQTITKSATTSSYRSTKNMGVIARLNYSYKSKYLFSASVRYDGASVLAEGHKWATFPAVSAGWRISEEKFMENTRSWLDNLKVRVGYGETGVSSIAAYSTLAGINQGTFVLGDELFNPYYNIGVADANGNIVIPNKDLTWERSKSWNFGLDATFFNGRIDFTADVYVTNTDGVIWQKPLPVTSGAANFDKQFTTNVNLAQTKNKGIELGLNTRNIETKGFKWTSALTFAYNKEQITSLSGTANNRVNKGGDGDITFEIGHPVNSWYHYNVKGIWQQEEADEAAIFGMKPGYIKIDSPNLERHEEGGKVYYVHKTTGAIYDGSDAEHTYGFAAADKQVIGHNSPDWTLGFQNTFTYKNFDLSIYMYMRWGQMIKYNLITEFDATMQNNNYANYYVGWTPENRSNDFPMLDASITQGTLAHYIGFDALQYVDGSFFKIKNITLGYTLPKKICAKWGIQNLRIYGTINNPLVVAKHHLLKDYDPEMNGSVNNPLTRQLVFGVNFSF